MKVRFSLKIGGPEVIKPHSECHPERPREKENAPHVDGMWVRWQGLAERPLTQSLLGWKRGSDGMEEKERRWPSLGGHVFLLGTLNFRSRAGVRVGVPAGAWHSPGLDCTTLSSHSSPHISVLILSFIWTQIFFKNFGYSISEFLNYRHKD